MLLEQVVSFDDFVNSKFSGATRVIGEVFGAGEFSNIPAHVMEEAIKRGHAVHEAIEHFILTGEDKILEPNYQLYYDQFIEWRKKYNPEFLACELRIISPNLGYKGIIDAVFKIGNTIVIGDWKTSSTLRMVKPTLQLNMYLLLLAEYGLEVDENTELRVLKLGKKDYKYVSMENNQSMVHHLLALFTFRRKLGE